MVFFAVSSQEVEQASTAMEGLQDSTLPSSDRGGMHIEYLFWTCFTSLKYFL